MMAPTNACVDTADLRLGYPVFSRKGPLRLAPCQTLSDGRNIIGGQCLLGVRQIIHTVNHVTGTGVGSDMSDATGVPAIVADFQRVVGAKSQKPALGFLVSSVNARSRIPFVVRSPSPQTASASAINQIIVRKRKGRSRGSTGLSRRYSVSRAAIRGLALYNVHNDIVA